MHDYNSFITLTYNNDHLPEGGSLQKIDFQKFIRALRQKTLVKMRYYMCGEYGGETQRPHYHAILFGYQFPDLTLWNRRRGNQVYRSKILESIWTNGNSEIGEVTFQSAAYVARYVMKKQNGEPAKSHYAIVDRSTGEITGNRIPEYTNMSLKPGIGRSWYDKYKNDVFPEDRCVTKDGRTYQTPRYYRELLEKEDPELYEELKKIRIEKARDNPDNTKKRLAVREAVQKAKLDRLKRTLHDD